MQPYIQDLQDLDLWLAYKNALFSVEIGDIQGRAVILEGSNGSRKGQRGAREGDDFGIGL